MMKVVWSSYSNAKETLLIGIVPLKKDTDIFEGMIKVYEVLGLMLNRHYLDTCSIVRKGHWHISRYDKKCMKALH